MHNNTQMTIVYDTGYVYMWHARCKICMYNILFKLDVNKLLFTPWLNITFEPDPDQFVNRVGGHAHSWGRKLMCFLITLYMTSS